MTLEATGLGDRRAEGFGEIRLQDPLVLRPVDPGAKGARHSMKSQDAAAILIDVPEDTATREALALRVQRAAWEDEIALQALERASDAAAREAAFGLTLKGGPSGSQLGRLREQVGSVRDRASAGAMAQWLRDETSAKEGNIWKAIAEAVQRLLDSQRLWEVLFAQAGSPPVLDGREQDAETLKRDLWAFAFRHFLFASLRAHGLAARIAARDAKTGG